MSHKIDFDKIPWTDLATGARVKIWSGDGKRVRLMEIRREFVEAGWCIKGHIIQVISGELEVDFHGRIESFRTGDTIGIALGDGHRARATTEMVLLFTVDDADAAA